MKKLFCIFLLLGLFVAFDTALYASTSNNNQNLTVGIYPAEITREANMERHIQKDEFVDTQNLASLPEAVTEAKKNGSEILKLTGEDGADYYFKKPAKMDINRYLASVAKGKLASAVENMVFDLAIEPSGESLKKMFKEQPGRVVAISTVLQGAVGINEEFAVKKL